MVKGAVVFKRQATDGLDEYLCEGSITAPTQLFPLLGRVGYAPITAKHAAVPRFGPHPVTAHFTLVKVLAASSGMLSCTVWPQEGQRRVDCRIIKCVYYAAVSGQVCHNISGAYTSSASLSCNFSGTGLLVYGRSPSRWGIVFGPARLSFFIGRPARVPALQQLRPGYAGHGPKLLGGCAQPV